MEPTAVAKRKSSAARRRRLEKVAHLVVRAAEPLCGRHALEPTHGPVASLDAAMVLLEMIVQVAARPVSDSLAEFGPDGAGIGIMTISCHPVRRDAGDCLRRGEECFGRRPIAGLTEPDIDQVAGSVDRPVEIAPAATYVSSVYQLRPILPRRALRSSSVTCGASFASQSRTASCVKMRPRSANISTRSRRLSLYRRRQNTTRQTTSVGYCRRLKRVPLRSLKPPPQSRQR